MLYTAVRPIAKIGLRYYYHRIDLANAHRIPKDKPVILASNHPTTFVEPCILACYLDRPLNFLARGDFFQKKLFAALLGGVHIIPIFRHRDGGTEGVKKNYESFEKCFEALSANKVIMILAEGRCIHEKRLRPIQKGTSRIALGAISNTDLDEVYIVPVGVNFAYADRARSDVMISFGEPILASDYKAKYEENANRAMSEFSQELRERMAAEIIIIERQEDEPLLEHLLQLYRSEHPRPDFPIITTEEEQLRKEKQIADAINAMPEAEKKELSYQTLDYFHRLHFMRISDAALKGNYRKEQKQTTKVLLGLIPAILLALWHLPPLMIAQYLAGTKIKTIEFSSPVRWGACLGLYLLYNLAWLIVPAALGAYWWMLVPLIEMAVLPRLIRYRELVVRWFEAWRVRRQTPHEIDYARKMRKSILEKVRPLWA